MVTLKPNVGIKKEDWAYLAGLIDGDGSIFCAKREKGNLYRLTVSISNNNSELLEEIHTKFGGGTGNWKSDNYTAFRLGWEAEKAKEIIRGILPYIKGKKAQAELALTFPVYGTGYKKPKSPEHKAKQETIYHQMRELNQKWSCGKVEGARQ